MTHPEETRLYQRLIFVMDLQGPKHQPELSRMVTVPTRVSHAEHAQGGASQWRVEDRG